MDAQETYRRLLREAAAERRKQREDWEERREREKIRDRMILNHLRALFGPKDD